MKHYDYSMFDSFIEKYLPAGFLNIGPLDAVMVQLDKKLAHNHQFFYTADLIRLKIIQVSKGSESIIGVSPNDFDLSTFLSLVHPDDEIRYGLARARLIKLGQDLLLKREGKAILSTHFRIKNSSGS